jgi:hypothetical protein
VTAFAAAAGASDEQLPAVRVVVAEAVPTPSVTRIRALPGPVEVTAAIASVELWLLVGDDGCGCAPTCQAKATP